MIPVSVRYQSLLDAARAALSAGARVLTASCGLATAQAEDCAGVFGERRFTTEGNGGGSAQNSDDQLRCLYAHCRELHSDPEFTLSHARAVTNGCPQRRRIRDFRHTDTQLHKALLPHIQLQRRRDTNSVMRKVRCLYIKRRGAFHPDSRQYLYYFTRT